MLNTFERYYKLRPSRDNSGKVIIYLRAYINQEMVELGSMKIKIDPKRNWCKKSNTVKNPDNDLDIENLIERLEAKKLILNEMVKYYNKHNKKIDGKILKIKFDEAIKNNYQFIGTHNVSVIELWDFFLKDNAEKLRSNTLRDYRNKKERMDGFLKLKKHSSSIFAWDRDFVYQYKDWMKTTYSMSESGVNKHIMRFKIILDHAVEIGKITENPIALIKTPQDRNTNLIFLDLDTIKKLRQYPFKGKYKKTVDMYLFSCFTGICHADMVIMKDFGVEVDKDGGLFIKSERDKNGSEFRTPILFYAKNIYDEFGGVNKIPLISNQKCNEYIKVALEKVGYGEPEKISFHSARKTFCNFCLNDLGIRAETVIKYTGHKDTKTLLRHYAVINTKVATKELNEALDKFVF